MGTLSIDTIDIDLWVIIIDSSSGYFDSPFEILQ